MTRARRMCPDAVVVAPDFETFATVSSSVMENFRRVTPLVEVLSLDEAVLDVRGSTRRLGSPVEIAERLRATIHDEQGITCSVGLAASMTMAKLASRWAKPDGVFVCPPSSVTTLLHPLDVGELYGVGEKTRELLHRLGLVTVGDLAHTPVRTLQRAVGDHLGRHLHDLAWGVDDRQVVARTSGGYFGVLGGDPDKSMGANETFGHDTDDRAVIVRELLRLTDRVTTRMRVAGVAGRTVTLTVRFADFTTITRSRTLPEATDVTQEVYRQAVRSYDALGLQRARIRLVGVRVEGLVPRATRPSPARPRRARPRVGGRGPGRRPGRPPLRGRHRPPCEPASMRRGSSQFHPPAYRTSSGLPTLASTDRPRGGSCAALRRRVASIWSRWSAPSSKRTPSSPPLSAGPTSVVLLDAGRSSPAAASWSASPS